MKLFYVTILLNFTFTFGQIQVQYKQQTIQNLSNVTDIKLKQEFELINNHITFYDLTIKDKESIYQLKPTINNKQGASNFTITSSEEENVYYTNITQSNYIFYTTYNDKKILIKDQLEPLQWILTKEEKSILGFTVRKATLKNDATLIEAWYAPELNYKNGPQNFWGLPGLILKIEANAFDSNGNLSDTMFIEAVEINLKDKTKWKIPTKGEVMTKAEYQDFQDKQYQIYLENKENTIDRKID
jgi:GLPGLI family protein